MIEKKTFTPFTCLLRLNTLFPLIKKNRRNRLHNQLDKIYHRKYFMCTHLILNDLCNNYTIFITSCELICKVID